MVLGRKAFRRCLGPEGGTLTNGIKVVKNPLPLQETLETWVQSLGRDDTQDISQHCYIKNQISKCDETYFLSLM